MSSGNKLKPDRYKQMVIDNIARKQKKAAALREHLKKSIDKTKENADGV